MKRKAPRKKGTGRKYGEGHIEIRTLKSGTVRYIARWYEPTPDGKQRLAQQRFPTHDEAEDYLRQVAREKRDGRYVSASTLTLHQLIDDWLRRNKSGWKGSTYATYRQRAYTHIIPALGKLKVVELTPARIQRWVDGLIGGGTIAAKTVEESKRVISSALNEAVRLDIIRSNPASSVRISARPPKGHVTWDDDEVATVLDATANDPMWRAVYSVVLMTGMRPGELRALKWEDLDLARRSIHIQRTITRTDGNVESVGTTTKTGRDRSVSIPDDTVDALKAWRVVQAQKQLASERWDDNRFIFTGSEGQYLPSTTWARYHDRLIQRAGVKRITLHETRHSNATMELAAGTHVKIVSDRLGHSKVETTINLYSHVSPDLHRSATDALAERIKKARKKASGE